MLEQKRSQNNFQITKNERQSNNKLNSYFQSSNFLTQQQELSLFIKNLPIIKIHQIKSINKLIEILIKQNEMLGNKCQHNILTIKEMYNKHEQLIKNNKLLQNKKNQISKQSQNNKALESTIKAYEENMQKMKSELQDRQIKIGYLIETQSIAKHQNQYYHKSLEHLGGLLELISQKNHKKVLQTIKQINRNLNKESMLSWINWQQIQSFIKDQKKKSKYHYKIKDTVDVFCSRFIKISQFVPQQLLKEEFYKQKNNLLQFLDELLGIKKKTNYNSGSQSHISFLSEANNFFENLLQKLIRQTQHRSLTKQDINKQLLQVKQELIQSKTSYQQYLIKIRIQYQEAERKLSQQLQSKSQVLEYYEQQKEQMMKDVIEYKGKMTQLQQTLKAQRHNLSAKEQQCKILESKLESTRNHMSLKQKQLKEQWDENIKTFQYKLHQKQELLQQQKASKKQLQAQLKQKINKYKCQYQKNEQQLKKLSTLLRQQQNTTRSLSIEKQNNEKKYLDERKHLEKELYQKKGFIDDYLRRIQKEMFQIKKLQDQNMQYERQLKINKEYIKELQHKAHELNNKIKTLENKKSEEKSQKKQISIMKQSMAQETKYLKEVQQQFSFQKDENVRLKSMIKQMKRQLQEVYVQVNRLKMIEGERETLIKQIQKSDRLKEQLYREYETLKIEVMKLTQQNKGLSLESKHYRSALARIQALKI